MIYYAISWNVFIWEKRFSRGNSLTFLNYPLEINSIIPNLSEKLKIERVHWTCSREVATKRFQFPRFKTIRFAISQSKAIQIILALLLSTSNKNCFLIRNLSNFMESGSATIDFLDSGESIFLVNQCYYVSRARSKFMIMEEGRKHSTSHVRNSFQS